MGLTECYKDEFVTVLHGDCSEYVQEGEPFDLLLTDPPYGIKADSEAAKKSGQMYGKSMARNRFHKKTNWDSNPIPQQQLNRFIETAKKSIVWGGNYYEMPPSSCWLIWDKENGGNDFADAEMAWTNLKGAVRLKRHLWNGMLRKGKEERFHPTQKPAEVISWAMHNAGDSVKTVFDPFAGSGTTGVVCKEFGIRCTLIEREESYCEIIKQRLQQEYFKF